MSRVEGVKMAEEIIGKSTFEQDVIVCLWGKYNRDESC
jgi:hypothetical protein